MSTTTTLRARGHRERTRSGALARARTRRERHPPIFPQLHRHDVCPEAELADAAVLEIVPDHDLVARVPRALAAANERQQIAAEQHLDDADEIALRADLQELAALDLDALGVQRHRSRLSMTDLARAVGDGAIALLLIDLTSLIDDPTPHWVTALTAHGDLVLIDDPWVETSIGESWVVTHELVVRAEQLESIVTWGSGYRGVILLTP